MRERPLDAAMGALKRVLDEGSRMLDANKATPFDVSRGLINAIPFAGPQLAKQFEQSNVSVPVGMSIDSRSPGIETFDMPTKDLMDAMKWSDLVGTSGASRAAESLGYGEAPDFFDALDATAVGAGIAGAAKMAPKAARAAKQGAKAGANLVGNAINDAMVYNQGPLAAITPQPMRMFIGPQAKTYDVGRAMKAEEMLKAGASPEEVWKATGTMIGKDGIPRQEISDAGSTFRDAEDLKQLKDAYKDIIAINKERIKPDRSGQKDMFPKQLTEARKPVREGIASLKEDLREIDKNPRTQGVAAKWTLEHPELYRAYPELADISVTQRPSIGAEKGSLSTLGGVIQNLDVKDIKDPRSVALHEMQHAIQQIEGMSPGANPEYAFSSPEYQAILDEIKAKNAGKYGKSWDEKNAAHEWYKRQHGEAEARNTQERANLSNDLRRDIYPYAGMDVPEDKLLLRKTVPFLGVSKQSSVVPDELKRAHESLRAKAAEDQALLDAYNKATRNMPLNERPTLDEFRAINVKPSQADLDQMRLELDERNMTGDGDVHMSAAGSAADAVKAARTAKAAKIAQLERLERAPAKSKEEIRAIAERIAPQVTGEYVRGKEGAKTVAGKTQKQFEREKTLEHDIRPTEGVEQRTPEKIDYEALKDNVIMGIAGDPTRTGVTVHGVAGTPLKSPAPQHGGPLYGLGRDDEHFWASNLGAARNVQNRAREIEQQYGQPVLGQYIMMGPDSYSYAQHFADANINLIDPTKMSKRDIESFNKLMREGYPYIDSKKVKRQRVFPSFPGIENPEEMYLQFAIDPDMRKHFGNLMQMPTVTEPRKMQSGLDVMHAVTEPELRDLEIGVTGHSVGRMLPDVKDLKLSSHPTYSHDIPGHFLGQSKYPIPYDIMFPDSLKSVRENPKQAPQELGSLKMIGPRQTIDQQMIDEIKQYEEMMKSLTGKAEGGEIAVKPKKMAEGGITAEDLEIEERPL